LVTVGTIDLYVVDIPVRPISFKFGIIEEQMYSQEHPSKQIKTISVITAFNVFVLFVDLRVIEQSF
jgi:hypothetical protein